MQRGLVGRSSCQYHCFQVRRIKWLAPRSSTLIRYPASPSSRPNKRAALLLSKPSSEVARERRADHAALTCSLLRANAVRAGVGSRQSICPILCVNTYSISYLAHQANDASFISAVHHNAAESLERSIWKASDDKACSIKKCGGCREGAQDPVRSSPSGVGSCSRELVILQDAALLAVSCL